MIVESVRLRAHLGICWHLPSPFCNAFSQTASIACPLISSARNLKRGMPVSHPWGARQWARVPQQKP
eukprot:4018558-Pyramimonas_sp.AAC.1